MATSFVVFALLAATALATVGALTQLPDPDGCVSESGGDCTQGKALKGANSVAASPDKKSVYVANLESAVAVFSRDTTSGKLTQLPGTDGCVSEDGTGGACADGKALQAPRSVAVSPEKKPRSVYSASNHSDAVAVFARSGS